MKKAAIILVGMIFGALLTLFWTKIIQPYLRYYGPATVTVINATGVIMSDVHVALNRAGASIGELRDGQQASVAIRGNFGESSTVVYWTDENGANSANADDYIEGCGFYHSTVVIMPNKKAKAIYGRIEQGVGGYGSPAAGSPAPHR